MSPRTATWTSCHVSQSVQPHMTLLKNKSTYLTYLCDIFSSCCLEPDDYNRVELTSGNGEAGCDYINASFIDV